MAMGRCFAVTISFVALQSILFAFLYLSDQPPWLCEEIKPVVSNEPKHPIYLSEDKPAEPVEPVVRHDERAPLPYYCGSAPFEEYIQLHRGILNGTRKQRYTVIAPVEAGAADRILAALSGLYYSILTDRAIRFVSYDDLPPLEAAFDSSILDWHSPYYDPVLAEHVRFTYSGSKSYQGDRSYPDYVDKNKYFPLFIANNDAYVDRIFLDENPADHPAGNTHVETIFMSLNRGRTFRIFDNKYASKKLYGMGLQPEYALACGFHLLFKPNAIVQAQFAELNAKLRDPEPLKIGIMIRVADWEFNGEYNMARADWYFQCAEEIEASRKRPGQNVTWHLLSASLSLRQQAKAKYGDKLLTDTATTVIHTDFTYVGEADKHKANQSMVHAMGELMAYVQNDYFVYTKHSGFAQIGAFLSGKRRNKYVINDGLHNKEAPTPRKCGVGDFDSEYYLSGLWSGV